jgi:hypothetical protein
MSLLALLTRRLGVLLGGGRVLFALRVITFSMLFGRSTMRFGGIFVMLGSLIVFVLRHWDSSKNFRVGYDELVEPCFVPRKFV